MEVEEEQKLQADKTPPILGKRRELGVETCPCYEDVLKNEKTFSHPDRRNEPSGPHR